MSQRVIIIHGTKGSPESNWFQWLKNELNKINIPCEIPKLPTPENQSLPSWLSEFNQQVGELTHDDILIGHSIGAALCLHLVLSQKETPKACFLIAPFVRKIQIPEYDLLNESFLIEDISILKNISSRTKFISIYSDDDPYVPMNLSEEVSEITKSKIIIIPKGKHLNSEAGYDTFSELKDELFKLLT